jgi:hypothetical protein
VQADAGKTGGTIKSLLIEHARLNKTPRALARLLSIPARSTRRGCDAPARKDMGGGVDFGLGQFRLPATGTGRIPKD